MNTANGKGSNFDGTFQETKRDRDERIPVTVSQIVLGRVGKGKDRKKYRRLEKCLNIAQENMEM